MIKFTGGDADGQTLLLRRSPLFLRVVIDVDGSVDALDQVDDKPKHNEEIIVYRRSGGAGYVRVCSRGRDGRGSQMYAIADYELYGKQPGDDVRETDAWQTWASDERDRILKELISSPVLKVLSGVYELCIGGGDPFIRTGSFKRGGKWSQAVSETITRDQAEEIKSHKCVVKLVDGALLHYGTRGFPVDPIEIEGNDEHESKS